MKWTDIRVDAHAAEHHGKPVTPLAAPMVMNIYHDLPSTRGDRARRSATGQQSSSEFQQNHPLPYCEVGNELLRSTLEQHGQHPAHAHDTESDSPARYLFGVPLEEQSSRPPECSPRKKATRMDALVSRIAPAARRTPEGAVSNAGLRAPLRPRRVRSMSCRPCRPRLEALLLNVDVLPDDSHEHPERRTALSAPPVRKGLPCKATV